MKVSTSTFILRNQFNICESKRLLVIAHEHPSPCLIVSFSIDSYYLSLPNSDVYLTYYPWISHPHNPGGAQMLTLEELQQKNVTASYVGGYMGTVEIHKHFCPAASSQVHQS